MENKILQKKTKELKNIYDELCRLQMRFGALAVEMEEMLNGNTDAPSQRKRRNLKSARILKIEEFYKKRGIL